MSQKLQTCFQAHQYFIFPHIVSYADIRKYKIVYSRLSLDHNKYSNLPMIHWQKFFVQKERRRHLTLYCAKGKMNNLPALGWKAWIWNSSWRWPAFVRVTAENQCFSQMQNKHWNRRADPTAIQSWVAVGRGICTHNQVRLDFLSGHTHHSSIYKTLLHVTGRKISTWSGWCSRTNAREWKRKKFNFKPGEFCSKNIRSRVTRIPGNSNKSWNLLYMCGEMRNNLSKCFLFWLYYNITTQEEEKSLYAKRNWRLTENRKCITILKAQGKLMYAHERTTSKDLSNNISDDDRGTERN